MQCKMITICTCFTFRHQIFWILEDHPEDCQDELLGDKVTEVMQKMQKRLSKGKLPHFFIRQSNLFASASKSRLKLAEDKVFRINENFVFFLIRALRQLQFAKDFYPIPDLDTLTHILTVKNAIFLLQNQQYLSRSTNQMNITNTKHFQTIHTRYFSLFRYQCLRKNRCESLHIQNLHY